LIPGDLILAAPLLAFSPRTYARMAVAASNGGLIPWQSGIATGVGRFQFVAGREMAIVFYGYLKEKDRLLMPPAQPGAPARLVALRSLAFDFPLVEYRPVRSFSLNQASILVLQIYVGFDVSNQASLIAPEGQPLPESRTILRLGARLAFDWRHY
jgi:hypothetical protein